MCVALGGTHRHARGFRDLLEREAESILEHQHAGLAGGEPGESGAELGPELGELRLVCRAAVGSDAHVLVERHEAATAAPLHEIAACVHGETVQPGRECRFPTELADLGTELGQRVLGRVPRILRIGEDVTREPLDARGMTRAQSLEGPGIAVLRTPHEDGIAQALVDDR